METKSLVTYQAFFKDVIYKKKLSSAWKDEL